MNEDLRKALDEMFDELQHSYITRYNDNGPDEALCPCGEVKYYLNGRRPDPHHECTFTRALELWLHTRE